MKKHDRVVLEKIVEESSILTQMIFGIDESAFLESEILKRATCMTLINIGELVKHLDNEIKLSNRHIQWKGVAAFRDIAAHRYLALRMDDVWRYTLIDLPVFILQISEILKATETE